MRNARPVASKRKLLSPSRARCALARREVATTVAACSIS